jgi:hypothetical protein
LPEALEEGGRIMPRKRRRNDETESPIHDAVFGSDEPRPMVDDTPRGASPANVNLKTPGKPGGFRPMREVGDTDPTDRQPDGKLQR